MNLRKALLSILLIACSTHAAVPLNIALGSLNIERLKEAFLREHRVFEKIIEQRSQWESPFCQGQGIYNYRVQLKTQLQKLEIKVEEDGSVYIKAELERPYVALQGKYQGAYSLCFPVGNAAELEAENAILEARVYFGEGDLEAGQLDLKVEVISVQFGTLLNEAFSPEFEEMLTQMLNQGLNQLWASHLGEWFSQTISFFLNQNFPIRP